MKILITVNYLHTIVIYLKALFAITSRHMCTIKREWDWREGDEARGILSLIIPWFYNSCKNPNSANDPIEISGSSTKYSQKLRSVDHDWNTLMIGLLKRDVSVSDMVNWFVVCHQLCHLWLNSWWIISNVTPPWRKVSWFILIWAPRRQKRTNIREDKVTRHLPNHPSAE